MAHEGRARFVLDLINSIRDDELVFATATITMNVFFIITNSDWYP